MQVILGEKLASTEKSEWIFLPGAVAGVLRSFVFRQRPVDAKPCPGEVGRLQFTFGEWKYPFTIYQTAPGEAAVALANAWLNCSPEGWLQRGVPGFRAKLQTTSATIRGNAADPETGRIQSEKITVPSHSNILKFGDLFSPLAFPDAHDAQLRERALEISARREKSLQRAIRTELARGAVYRMMGGFIYRNVSAEMFPQPEN